MATTSSRAMFVLVLSLALCTQSVNAATEQDIDGVFNTVTVMSSILNSVVDGITFENAPAEGIRVAPGFRNIVNTVGEATSMLQNDPSQTALSDSDTKLVVDALTTFVHVHQALLATVIGKHRLPTMIPYTEPIRQALSSLESTVDTFAFVLINFIAASSQSDCIAQFGGLRVQIDKAIKVYSCDAGPACPLIGQ